MTGFATLRKKFIRRRRSSKACDHGRIIRDLVSTWSHLEATALLEEYEALAALKDLHVQAELARPPAATYKQDLSKLYDYKHCSDVDLVYRGACFPVHRALLSARCPYFRDLLAGCPGISKFLPSLYPFNPLYHYIIFKLYLLIIILSINALFCFILSLVTFYFFNHDIIEYNGILYFSCE